MPGTGKKFDVSLVTPDGAAYEGQIEMIVDATDTTTMATATPRHTVSEVGRGTVVMVTMVAGGVSRAHGTAVPHQLQISGSSRTGKTPLPT